MNRSKQLGLAVIAGLVVGSLAASDTNVPVPVMGAAIGRHYFISQLDAKADDNNPGTEASPFKSINGCLQKIKGELKPGDTVWIKNGTYREGLRLHGLNEGGDGHGIASGRSFAEMISLAACLGHRPVIKGSDIVTGWTKYKDNIWVKEGWSFNSQQVFADDQILDQIGGRMAEGYVYDSWGGRNKTKTLNDMLAGSFYYDIEGKKLYAWLKDNRSPNDALVEADARCSLVSIGALDYIRVSGLTLRHGSNNGTEFALGSNGRYGIIEHIDQAWHAFGGGYAGGEYLTFSNCKFNWNGNNGMGGRKRGHRILFCETKYNNYRNWSTGWHAGGTKFIPYCHDWVVKGHVSAYNNGDGIWFDGFMSNITIEECFSYRNRGAGIHYEIGSRGVIKNNVIYENGARGIYLSNGSYSLVANNLCYHNEMSGICSIVARRDSELYGRGEDKLIPGGNNVISGNILVDNCWGKQLVEEIPKWDMTDAMKKYYLEVLVQWTNWGNRPELIMPEQKGGNEGSYSDYNIFYRSESRGKPESLAFGRNWNVGFAYGLEDWRKKTGWDMNSVFLKPKFVDETNRDFRPADDCPSLWFVKKPDQSIQFALEGGRPGWDSPVTAGPYGGKPELFKEAAGKMSADKNLLCKLPHCEEYHVHKLSSIPGAMRKALNTGYITALHLGIKLNNIPFLMDTSGVIYLNPERNSGEIALNWTAKQIYILFAAENFEKQPFAKITALRDDGVNIEIKISSDGKDGFAASTLKAGQEIPVPMAWQGESWYYNVKQKGYPSEPVKVLMLTWNNDNPWLPIRKLEFKLLDPKAEMAVVGISGESNK